VSYTNKTHKAKTTMSHAPWSPGCVASAWSVVPRRARTHTQMVSPKFPPCQQTRRHARKTEENIHLIAVLPRLPDARQPVIAFILEYTGGRGALYRPAACGNACAGFLESAMRLAARRRCCGTEGCRRRGTRDIAAPPQSTHPCDALLPAIAQASAHIRRQTLDSRWSTVRPQGSRAA